MFLRLELFGHYLELGQTTETEAEPTITDHQYPMTLTTDHAGFRVIGPGEYIEDQCQPQRRRATAPSTKPNADASNV